VTFPEEPDARDEDAAWRDIVEHYGDRVQLDPGEVQAPPVPAEPAPVFDDSAFGDEGDDEFDPFVGEDVWDEGEFVPPAPPPLPRTTPEKYLAWIGVIGAPVATVVIFLLHSTTGLWIPDWVTGVLVVVFLCSFGYLVSKMPREPRDPWDDGARV